MKRMAIIQGCGLNTAKLCGLLLAAAGALWAQSPSHSATPSLEREFQAAMAAQDKGDLETARSLLTALHRKHPGIFAVDESLGLLYVAQEKYTEALPLLDAAVREQPSSAAAHANLGAALSKLHRNKEALVELQRAVQIDPQSETAQQSLGQVLLDEHQPERAAETFATALHLKPGDDDLTLSYAAALVAAKRYAEAAQAISSAKAAGQSAFAQSLLGEIDEKNGNFQSAAEHFTKAVELDPSEENAWALGVEFLRHWTFEAAIHEFEAAAAKFPESARIRFGLGAAYFGEGKYAEAIPVFANLLDSAKDSALYAELLGIACNSVTESAKARCSGLISYAEAHPQDAKACTYAASMLLTETASDERLSLAGKLLNDALAADPKSADAQYETGVLHQNQGDWPGSIKYLERAVELKPDFAQAHYHLALAYWRSGRKEEGQEQMELQKKYAKQGKEDLDQRLRQITTFVVEIRK